MLCRSVVSDSVTPCPVSCSLPGSSVYGNSPGKNTGVGSLSLLQGISPTQESNWGLLDCRWILYQLSYQGSPVLPEDRNFPDDLLRSFSIELTDSEITQFLIKVNNQGKRGRKRMKIRKT